MAKAVDPVMDQFWFGNVAARMFSIEISKYLVERALFPARL